uniref:glycerophosphocholine cholinephosphodiesterase n=1 Tax=Romanomermis culicivorax TaxID=13658 RepID=A0A915J0B2_ROMCU
MEPHFPTSTFPSYASLVTGVYPENHGIIGDYMFDQNAGEYFVKGTISDRSKSTWFKGTPLWETAKKQVRFSPFSVEMHTLYSNPQDKNISLYWWPGCDSTGMAIDKKLCSHDGTSPSLERAKLAVGEILEKFTENSLDGALVHVDEVDFYGQFDGLGYWYRKSIEHVDSFLRHIKQSQDKTLLHHFVESRLSDLKLTDTVSHIIISPYGISWPSTPSNIIVLSTYVPEMGSYFSNFFGGSYLLIYVPKDKFSGVYKRLAAAHNHLKVYSKWNAPARWRLGIGDHVPSLIVVADPGWIVVMKNYEFQSIDLIDIYQLLAFSMGLSPEVNRGNIKNIEHLLILEDQEGITYPVTESYSMTGRPLENAKGDTFFLVSDNVSGTTRIQHVDTANILPIAIHNPSLLLSNDTVVQQEESEFLTVEPSKKVANDTSIQSADVSPEINLTIFDASSSLTVNPTVDVRQDQIKISALKFVIIDLKTGNLYESEKISTISANVDEILLNNTVTNIRETLYLGETSTPFEHEISNASGYDSLSTLISENDDLSIRTVPNITEKLIAESSDRIMRKLDGTSYSETLESWNTSFIYDHGYFNETQNFSAPIKIGDTTDTFSPQFQNVSSTSVSETPTFPGEDNDEKAKTTNSLITVASDYASAWSEKIGFWFKRHFIL